MNLDEEDIKHVAEILRAWPNVEWAIAPTSLVADVTNYCVNEILKMRVKPKVRVARRVWIAESLSLADVAFHSKQAATAYAQHMQSKGKTFEIIEFREVMPEHTFDAVTKVTIRVQATEGEGLP